MKGNAIKCKKLIGLIGNSLKFNCGYNHVIQIMIEKIPIENLQTGIFQKLDVWILPFY